MTFTKNIRAFRGLEQSDLVDAYGLLVAIELALKDRNCSGTTGHDVPGMLVHLSGIMSAAGNGMIAAQLTGFAARLRNDLGKITCQHKNGTAGPVPIINYPYMRYCRHVGDWAGIGETPGGNVTALLNTCRNTESFIAAHAAATGVSL